MTKQKFIDKWIQGREQEKELVMNQDLDELLKAQFERGAEMQHGLMLAKCVSMGFVLSVIAELEHNTPKPKFEDAKI